MRIGLEGGTVAHLIKYFSWKCKVLGLILRIHVKKLSIAAHSCDAYTHSCDVHTHSYDVHTHTPVMHTHTPVMHTHTHTHTHTHSYDAHTHSCDAHIHFCDVHTLLLCTHSCDAHKHTPVMHTHTPVMYTHSCYAHTYSCDVHTPVRHTYLWCTLSRDVHTGDVDAVSAHCSGSLAYLAVSRPVTNPFSKVKLDGCLNNGIWGWPLSCTHMCTCTYIPYNTCAYTVHTCVHIHMPKYSMMHICICIFQNIICILLMHV